MIRRYSETNGRDGRGEISYYDRQRGRQNFEDSRSMSNRGQEDPGEDHASRCILIFYTTYLELSSSLFTPIFYYWFFEYDTLFAYIAKHNIVRIYEARLFLTCFVLVQRLHSLPDIEKLIFFLNCHSLIGNTANHW